MVKIATRYDIPRLMEMIEQYALENPSIEMLKDQKLHNPKHIEQLLFSIIVGKGFILMDKNMRGCFIAIRSKNIWCPDVFELHQLMWWVEPEHRGFLSGKLWKAFDDFASQLIKEKKVHLVFTSMNPQSSFIDLSKRGYSAIESKFCRGE